MPHPRYNGDHRRLQPQLQTKLDRGETLHCTNPHCRHPGTPISATRGTPLSLNLGHNPDGTYRGPEHATCNQAEGGRTGAARRQAATTPQHHTWQW